MTDLGHSIHVSDLRLFVPESGRTQITGAGERLARASEYAAAGVDLPVLFPMPADGDWGYEKTIAAMAGKIT